MEGRKVREQEGRQDGRQQSSTATRQGSRGEERMERRQETQQDAKWEKWNEGVHETALNGMAPRLECNSPQLKAATAHYAIWVNTGQCPRSRMSACIAALGKNKGSYLSNGTVT